MEIRSEDKKDFDEIKSMLKESFKSAVYKDGDEHYVPKDIRGTEAYIKELSLVCEMDGRIVGYIMFSKTYVLNSHNNEKVESILAEPLAVDINYRSYGIGSKLIEKGLDVAKKMGYKSCFLIGDINYYKRFDFVDASNFSIYTNDDHSNKHLLALQLESNSLNAIEGCLHLYWVEDRIR